MMFDLMGIGIGPFNLSLAALLEKVPHIKSLFLDKKEKFTWHPELMFSDTTMQTSFLTDLVTPADPTNAYSFLNYLAHQNLFYHFLNTERMAISRLEFEQYCQWVANQLAPKIRFNRNVHSVTFKNGHFIVSTEHESYFAKNICVATGLSPRIPECAEPLLSNDLFFAKSTQLAHLNVTGKTVTLIGGGQTGIEIFRNILHGKWGHAKSIRLVTSRNNLESYDTSPFTNDYFTPSYLDSFWEFPSNQKHQVVAQQYLESDGNTPHYLLKLYNDLYQKKYVEHDHREITVLARRTLTNIQKTARGYTLTIHNQTHDCDEQLESDIIILCTGFQSTIPSFLNPLFPHIHFDQRGRFIFDKSYAIHWDGPTDNRIYALNFSRHQHGIIDPQTNLMAWRSGLVVNDLTQENIYKMTSNKKNFVQYDRYIERRRSECDRVLEK